MKRLLIFLFCLAVLFSKVEAYDLYSSYTQENIEDAFALLQPETVLEEVLINSPEWREGAVWGARYKL